MGQWFLFTHIVSLRSYLIFEFAFVREKLVCYNYSYLKYALDAQIICRNPQKYLLLIFNDSLGLLEVYFKCVLHVRSTSNINDWKPFSSHFSLPKGGGLPLGRQEVHAVAEQRKHEIARFLESLFSLNISISQSDLIYTFFHPLLRDQQDADIHLRKLRGTVLKSWFLANYTMHSGQNYDLTRLYVNIAH